MSRLERIRSLALALEIAGCIAPAMAYAQSPPSQPASVAPGPALVNICLITQDVKGLVSFYEQVLQAKATWSGPDYAEFPTGVGVLAIFSAEAQEKYIPGSAQAGGNKGVILEFRVADPDAEYKRLSGIVKTWVKPPTTQPWGTRSIYFRDPDGNLVDFYTPPRTR